MVRNLRAIGATLFAVALIAATAGTTLAHERREVGEYTFVVGFLDEPVYAGSESGLDLRISRGEEPVSEVEATLDAEVWYQNDTANKRALELSESFSTPGSYSSVFYPTSAGQYSFRVFGTIEEQAVDETFVSSDETFNHVQDVVEAQFPVQFPNQAELATGAEAGRTANNSIPIAIGLGAAGLLVGLVALGLSLAARRRAG